MCQCQKNRLSLRQESLYLNCLRELQAEGIGVDIPDEWLDRACPLDINVAPPPISMAFDWPTGGAGYAVRVRLLSRRQCMLEDCALAVPWDERIIIQAVDECRKLCNFGSIVFSLDEVLNHRIEKTLRFPRAGHVVEGVILGRGVARIPEKYGSCAPAPFTLTLYDQFGEELTQQGHLSVEHSRKSMKAITTEKHTLFGNSQHGLMDTSAEVRHQSSPLVNTGSSTQAAEGKGD